jgi:cell division GTPase FtsZ
MTMQNDKNKKPIHIIGLGGAGSNMVEYIHNKDFQAKFTMVTKPIRTNLPSEINFIEYVSKGIYFGKDGDKVRFSDFSQPVIVPKKLNNFFSNDYHYVLLAGFGGFTGTVLTRELAFMLKENLISFNIICTMPFEFEGQIRKIFANSAKQKLQDIPNIQYFDLDIIREKYGNLLMEDAFEKANEEIYLCVIQQLFNI